MTFRQTGVAIVAMSLLVIGTAPSAQAGPGAFLGLNFPTGDFNKGADTGWTLGGYYTTPLLPLVEVGGLLAYNDFGGSGIPEFDDLFGGSFNAWEIQALGQANVFFFKGFLGLGLANYTGIGDAGNSERKTKFAWQLGAAAQFLFLEGRLAYHKINFDGGSSNWISLSAGLTF